MNFKLFAAVFGVLLAVQASQQSPLKDDDLKQIVVALYSKVLSLERDALSKVSDFVQNLETDKAKVEAEVVSLITKVANALNVVIINVLEDLREDASSDGKAVLNCINAEQTKTDAAFNKIAADLGVCFVENKLINTALTELINQLSGLIDKAQTEVDALGSCDSGDLVCFMTFLETRAADFKDVVALVKEDLQKAEQLVVDLFKMILSCVKTEYPVLKSSVQEIFNEAVVCIKS